jgi:hypothetical protein
MTASKFKSRTERLPKGLSYPLKPSILSAAVAAAGLSLPVEFTRWDEFECALKADFHPARLFGEEKFWVRCRAVPSAVAADVRAIVEARAVPRFIEWAKEIEALDLRSPIRRERQTFTYGLDAAVP